MDRKKILIVDDEDDIREVAAMSLEMSAGWQVLRRLGVRSAGTAWK